MSQIHFGVDIWSVYIKFSSVKIDDVSLFENENLKIKKDNCKKKCVIDIRLDTKQSQIMIRITKNKIRLKKKIFVFAKIGIFIISFIFLLSIC